MQRIDQSINVNAPLKTAYNQWTQFEDFPKFMEGIKSVTQLDASHLHWRAEIAGKDVEWEAEIIDQVPDRRIVWRSISGARHGGKVEFLPLDENSTEIRLVMEYDPEGLLQNLGHTFGITEARVRGDLERFKGFIENVG